MFSGTRRRLDAASRALACVAVATTILAGPSSLSAQETAATPGVFSQLAGLPPSFVPVDPPAAAGGFRDRVEEQLDKGCTTIAGYKPYAETTLERLRRPLSLSAPAKRALLAARLSQSARFAEAQLATFLTSASAEERFAAALTLGYVAIRAGDGAEAYRIASNAAEIIRSSAPTLRAPDSDADYIEAVIAAAQGDERKALSLLRDAIEKEPAFFAALMLSVRLQIDEVGREERFSSARCLGAYQRFLGDLSLILDIGACPSHAADMDNFVMRMNDGAKPKSGFFAAKVYLAVIARQKGAAQRALESYAAQSRASCRGSITAELRSLIDLL